MAIEAQKLGQVPEDASRIFEQLAEPFRREIKLHCYRMLGSLHEADDLVQETYLRAWRSISSFDGGSMRAWLYKIATNACLNALESRKHQQRYLPDQLGPAGPPKLEGGPALDVPWLEPYPDSNLEGIADGAPNPEARYTVRESVQLAFVAAIQQLPPRQRAALMLCDVLGWASAEAATLLESSTASINSALQRARETLSAQKVFLANGGAAPVLAKAFSEAGLTNEPYSSFYSALRSWGNWQILSSPDGADLVLVVSAEASPGTYYKGMPNYNLDLELRIIDGKTRLPLWTLRQPLEGAFLKSTFERNYRSSITGLITQLKQLAPPRPQTP